MTVYNVSIAQMPYDQLYYLVHRAHKYSQVPLSLAQKAAYEGWLVAVTPWFFLYLAWAFLLIFVPFFIAEKWVLAVCQGLGVKKALWMGAAILSLLLFVVFYNPWFLIYGYMTIWLLDAVYIVIVLGSLVVRRLIRNRSDDGCVETKSYLA